MVQEAKKAQQGGGAGKRARSVTLHVNRTRKLGRYELAFELASGGFAVVYLAQAKGPGGFEKFVALKRIHSHMATETEFVEMFLDEARIAACINHPFVCPVFDFGEADGAYFLAMDFVFGEPVSDVARALRRCQDETLKRRRFPMVARIVADAAEGLHAAHEAIGPDDKPLQVIHRDVAPANIFIRFDGHVQMVDFGIASAAGKMHMTATGVMKGHLSYVAPEQFRGEAIDRRVDVWSLGVVLWELLACKRLFKRESDVKTMFAVTEEPYRSARAVDPAVPEALDLIARKALAKRPEDRYQSAREMSEALHQYLQTANRVTSPYEIAEWLSDMLPGAEKKKRQILRHARAVLSAGSQVPLEKMDRQSMATASISLDKAHPSDGHKKGQRDAGRTKKESSSSAPSVPSVQRGMQVGAQDAMAPGKAHDAAHRRSTQAVHEWWMNPWFWVALAGLGVLAGAFWSLVAT